MEWYWFVALGVGFWFSGYCIGRAHAKEDRENLSKLLRDLKELVCRAPVPDPPVGSMWVWDGVFWTRVR